MTVPAELSSFASSVELGLLIKATLVLLGAIVGLRVMHTASASARYLVAVSAFAILMALPIAGAFLPTVAIALATPEPPRAATTNAGAAAATVHGGGASEPGRTPVVDDAPVLAGTRRSADAAGIRPLPLLRAVWLTGGIAFVAPILLALWRARSLRVTAMAWAPGDVLARELANEAGILRRVRVLRHDGVAAPMTCGIFRPVILIPWDASDWPTIDIRRALIHELEHVRRGDWVAHLIARTACAIYWLHPLVWTCWRHLHLDAERACDDAVVRQSGGETYAAQLLRLAERMSHSDTRLFLAMASSGDLTVRVRSALDAHRRRDRVGAWWKLSAGCAALVCVAALAPLHAVMVAPAGDRFVDSLADAPAAIQAQPRTVAPFQAANPDARRTPARGPSEERFGIATVRRGIGPQPNGSYLASDMATVRRSLGMVTFNDNEFIVHGASIRLLIENAFGIGTSGNEDRRYTSIEGIPSWPERFDVEARPARPITRGREFPPAEVRSMLQNLLADRFELVAHWEPRDKVVYDLLRDGLPGPRLQRCAELPDLCQNGRRGFSNGTSRLPGQSDFTRSYGMYGYPLTLFIRNLEIDLRRPIIDRTGLEGPYSLELEHLVHYSGGRIIQTSSGPMSIPGLVLEMSAVPPNENWLALSAALREQLGLRLEPRAASEEVLVIDRVSLPAYDSPRSP